MKPCPHCGEVPDPQYCFLLTDGYKWGRVVCGCTEVRTGYQEKEFWADSAIKAWNQRVKEVISAESDERCPVKE